MAHAAAQTGAGPTVLVGVEQHFPADERLIDDPLAPAILPFGLRTFVALMRVRALRDWMVRKTEASVPGLWAGMMCRKRYIDDELGDALGDVEAVVNLGAGFDTRLYRLPGLGDVPVWEVDQPENVRPKRDRLRALFGDVPGHATLVSIDFDREDLAAVLSANGYPADRPTFFVWEAVTQYLTEAGIRSTLSFLGEAPRGSRLAFTYVRKDFLEGRNTYGNGALFDKYVAGDGVWRFGLDPGEVDGFLEPYGWHVRDHVGCDDLMRRYVEPTGRRLASFPIERIVSAVKA